MTDSEMTLRRLREIVEALQRTAYEAGDAAAGAILAEAAAGPDDPEGVLMMRSAMISTRPTWEPVVSRRLRADAFGALAAAKDFVIDSG